MPESLFFLALTGYSTLLTLLLLILTLQYPVVGLALALSGVLLGFSFASWLTAKER